MPIFSRKGKNKNKLTPKEKGFCDDYIETGNGSEAARRNYNVANPYNSTARVIASHVLSRPHIQNYLEGMAEGAISRIEQLSIGAKNESVKLSANKDILDRAGWGAVSRTDITTSVDILSFYTDLKIKSAASEIVKQSNPDMRYTPDETGADAPDAGTASQE
jgi:hypothetical protein